MNNNPLNVIKEFDLSLFEQIGDAHELAFKDGEIKERKYAQNSRSRQNQGKE